jgi:hypothetical protein
MAGEAPGDGRRVRSLLSGVIDRLRDNKFGVLGVDRECSRAMTFAQLLLKRTEFRSLSLSSPFSCLLLPSLQVNLERRKRRESRWRISEEACGELP